MKAVAAAHGLSTARERAPEKESSANSDSL